MKKIHHKIFKKLGLDNTLYCFVKGFYFLSFSLKKWNKRKPILVYQMGKVGSRTVVETLRNQNLNRPVFHVHYLTANGLGFIQEKSEALGRVYPGRPYWAGIYLREVIRESNQRSFDVIALTREPVARNISAFFHAMDYWFPDISQQSLKGPYSTELFRNLRNTFLDEYDHKRSICWFEEELEEVFGINVYESKFPRGVGFAVYKSPSSNALVIKLEGLNETFPRAFQEFLGVRLTPEKLIKANVAKNKIYYPLYRSFIEWVKLPDEYLDGMYSSRYATHFYTSEEISRFREKWR